MPEHAELRVGDWTFEPSRNRLSRGNQASVITPLASRVLEYLAENADRVVSVDELTDKVWRRTYVGDVPVYRVVADLRRRLAISRRSGHVATASWRLSK